MMMLYTLSEYVHATKQKPLPNFWKVLGLERSGIEMEVVGGTRVTL